MLVNPRKRRRTTKKRRSPKRRTRRRNPVAANPRRRKSRRRYRRNPRPPKLMAMVQKSLMPSVTAASGALGLDFLMGYAPIPDNLKTGPMRHLVKGAGAIGLGYLASMFVKADTAQQFTTGALTVTVYDAAKQMINQFMPEVGARLGEVGYYYEDEMMGLGYQGAGYAPMQLESDVDGMGYYYSNDMNDMDSVGEFETDDIEL